MSQMMALCFDGKQKIALKQVPVPTIKSPSDVIVRIVLCGICGSDLHPFHEREKGLQPGTIVGHESVGYIETVGAEVQQLRVGDRVMCPFTSNCGACFFCTQGLTCRCSHPSARLFGWVTDQPQQQEADPHELQGSQTQYVRVPLADSTLVKVPEGVSNEVALLLGDILSTAFFCAEQGGVSPGQVVAVVGCGPVGLLAVLAARHYGAAQVVAVDGVQARRDKAASFGATAVAPDAAAAAVSAATEGRGADVVLEVVGAPSALQLAFDLLRPAGVLSSVGVHTHPTFPFSPVDAYNKNLTLKAGRCPARVYMEKLLPMVSGSKLPFTDIITHRLPLADGVRAYQLFDQKLEGCIKVVLEPWAEEGIRS